MPSLTDVYASSKSLIELQSELRTMSNTLQKLHDTLWGNLNTLGKEWTDEKMEEFNREFKRSRRTVEELSEKYKQWADSYLPPIIEDAIDYEESRVGIK